ncbi:protein trichome birefringence-like 2 [Gastrolobium bilobum]|uniref:protein trichome birefringence-like 2 n=1 Tax=Gastrolobium bilobum TaxID=150636 RepID=UPI002AAF3F00|nr:protein trichome birefringence-like 2 [Gastrolobium bilobum]
MDSNNSKRLAFSELFMSQRRKVVSGYSLGVGVSLLFLTLLFLNSSLKAPQVQVFLQRSDAASFSSWHFRISTYPFSSSSASNASVSSMQRIEEGSAVGEKGLEKKTHLGNLTENRDNASLHVEEQRFPQETTRVGNGALTPEKENFSDPNGVVKDEPLPGEKRKFSANSSLSGEAKTVMQKNNNVGNSSCNGNPGEEGKLMIEKSNVTVIGHDSRQGKMQVGFHGNCDIFDGNWVRDDSKPYYPLGSCPHIDRDFDCHLNGRPDSEYVKWKWQPNGCDIPSLNATDFLEKLRGQRLVFVGDSLNRNMWESMVCILRQSIRDKKRVFEISGRTKFKKKGVYAFRFEDYNCSVDFVSSPFIVRESTFKGINGSFETLRLDLMDQTTTMYHDADIIVFNTGHWWTHEKTSKGEDYYQEGNHVYPRLKVLDAYTRALTTWARWINNNIDANRTQVFFRGYSVTHFRGGQWNSGGQCHKETEPIYNGTHLRKHPSKMRALEHVIPKMKTPVIYMNISRLTDYRKDGHPSIYRMEYKTSAERTSAELHQDCSHWCLPGVPDTWNELLYASLLKYGKGNWKN